MNGYKIVLLKAIFMLYRLPECERVCSGICIPSEVCPIISFVYIHTQNRVSRNLVGICIQVSESEEEELFVCHSSKVSPEEFDFGIERLSHGV